MSRTAEDIKSIKIDMQSKPILIDVLFTDDKLATMRLHKGNWGGEMLLDEAIHMIKRQIETSGAPMPEELRQ